MKQISFWASRHKSAARIILILLYIPLNIAGLLTGSLLNEIGISFTTNFIYTIFILVLSVYFFYPAKASYYKRKLFEGAIAGCTFCILCFYGNKIDQPGISFSFINPSHAVTLSSANNTDNIRSFSDKKLSEKNILKDPVEKKPMKKWVKIVFIILTILVAAGFLYLLAALSCSIACSGSEAAAWVVFLLGTFGIVFGSVKLIQLINRGRRKNKHP